MVDLGSLGGGNTYAAALNDNGQVAGTSFTPGFEKHAFCWANGQMTDLGTFPEPYNFSINAISAQGDLFGTTDYFYERGGVRDS